MGIHYIWTSLIFYYKHIYHSLLTKYNSAFHYKELFDIQYKIILSKFNKNISTINISRTIDNNIIYTFSYNNKIYMSVVYPTRNSNERVRIITFVSIFKIRNLLKIHNEEIVRQHTILHVDSDYIKAAKKFISQTKEKGLRE